MSRHNVQIYGVPFVSKFFLKNYDSGTNQMGTGGFLGGAPFLQMADSWTWEDSFIFVFQELRIKSKLSLGTIYCI